MKVKVLYFSSIKDKLKKNSDTLDINEKMDISSLVEYLKNMYPEISDILEKSMVAVNEEYVDKSYILKENDTVAIIPPVSGG